MLCGVGVFKRVYEVFICFAGVNLIIYVKINSIKSSLTADYKYAQK